MEAQKKLLDDLLREVKVLLDARKHASFDVYAAGLRVRQATQPEFRDLPKLKTESTTFPRIPRTQCRARVIDMRKVEAFNTYLTFSATPGDWRASFTLHVQVERRKESSKFYLDKPMVRWSGKFIRFDNFLDELVNAPPFFRPVGQEGFDALHGWYLYRGIPFTFFKLPVELRFGIYRIATGGEIYPRVGIAWSRSIGFGAGWTPEAPTARLVGTHDPADEVAPPNLSLVLVNKQIRDEMMQEIWIRSRICFPDTHRLRYLLDFGRFNNQPAGTLLRRMCLNFDNETFFKFFGARVFSFGIVEDTFLPKPATILRGPQLPNLEKLDLQFRSTCWQPLTNPWSVAWMNEVDGGTDISLYWQDDCACQKTVTTMILALAFEYVQHLGEVTVSGYIKDSTKREFNKVLQELKNDPGSNPTWPITKSEVMTYRPGQVPPPCHCSASCGFWGVKFLFDPQNYRRRDTPQSVFKKYSFSYDD